MIVLETPPTKISALIDCCAAKRSCLDDKAKEKCEELRMDMKNPIPSINIVDYSDCCAPNPGSPAGDDDDDDCCCDNCEQGGGGDEPGVLQLTCITDNVPSICERLGKRLKDPPLYKVQNYTECCTDMLPSCQTDAAKAYCEEHDQEWSPDLQTDTEDFSKCCKPKKDCNDPNICGDQDGAVCKEQRMVCKSPVPTAISNYNDCCEAPKPKCSHEEAKGYCDTQGLAVKNPLPTKPMETQMDCCVPPKVKNTGGCGCCQMATCGCCNSGGLVDNQNSKAGLAKVLGDLGTVFKDKFGLSVPPVEPASVPSVEPAAAL
jgi:hypothetical protein